jgi:uncharacterized protein (TIGR02996 family)
MITGDALLQAVIDAPDDDAPRLAYADHREALGDSDRAAFIRVQCALDKMATKAPERPALEARERGLLERCGWDWAAEFGTKITQWVYRRGFIERVEMGLETSAEEILAILAMAPIRHIRDIRQFCELQGVVDALPYLDRLTGLEFWSLYAFDDRLVARMLASPHLRNLRTLVLHHDRNGNMVKERVLIEGLAEPHRANLEELGVNIDGTWQGPSNRVIQAMASSPYLRRLRKLYLSNAGDRGNRPRMNVKTARAMGQSPNFAGLEELDLGYASFPIEAWDEVLKWPWLSHLKWLRLHHARQVNPPSVMTVAELEKMPEYRRVFEERVARVDWETRFVGPRHGEACWRGLAWVDRPRRLLYDMNRYIARRDYPGPEAEYRRLCEEFSGEEAAREIDALSFDRYEEELRRGFERAVAALEQKGGRCVFLRLRPDIEWKGDFHVHRDDPDIREPREEFSYEGPMGGAVGPRFREAADIYARQSLFSGTRPSGTALYLLAKTVAALGRCSGAVADRVPVYFSCIYAVFRM